MACSFSRYSSEASEPIAARCPRVLWTVPVTSSAVRAVVSVRGFRLLTVPFARAAMTPKVLSEARLIDKERVQLLGQLTAELLVKAGCVGGWWWRWW